MSNPNKSPFIIKLLALLALIFGGAGLTVGLIGLTGYSGLYSDTLFNISIGSLTIKFSKMLPLVILSIFYFIFSLVSLGAGFSFVKGQRVAVKKTRTTAILFLIMFVFYLIFGLIVLSDYNMLGEANRGLQRLPSKNIIVPNIESSLISRKKSDIRFDDYYNQEPNFETSQDIVRWLITPMRVKTSDFKDDILEKIKDNNKRKLIQDSYTEEPYDNVYILNQDINKQRMDEIISILSEIDYIDKNRVKIITENNITITDTPTLFYLEASDVDENSWNIAYALMNNITDNPDMQGARYYINLRKYEEIETYTENTFNRYTYKIALYDTDTEVYIDALNQDNENIEIPIKSISVDQNGTLIVDGVIFNNIADEDKITETPSITDYQAIEDENTREYTITITWDREINSEGIEELDTYTINEEEERETYRNVYSSDEYLNKFTIDVMDGKAIYVRIDDVNNNIKTILNFMKLSTKQLDVLKESLEKNITNEPTLYSINDISDGLRVNIIWKSDDTRESNLVTYRDLDESKETITKSYPRHDFMHKFDFVLDRNGTYLMDVSYDKALPFSFIGYLLIFVLGLLYPIILLLIINNKKVKEWEKSEEIAFEGPDGLTQMAGINILLLPLMIWLSSIYIDDFAPSPHWIFGIMGIIGILYIVSALIGVASGYALMSRSGSTGSLMKTFTYGLIFLLLATVVVSLITASNIPKNLWPAVELLYQGDFPSINYIPRASNVTAIIIFAGILFSNFILIIYPLFYLRGRLKGENVKNYLKELKNN